MSHKWGLSSRSCLDCIFPNFKLRPRYFLSNIKYNKLRGCAQKANFMKKLIRFGKGPGFLILEDLCFYFSSHGLKEATCCSVDCLSKQAGTLGYLLEPFGRQSGPMQSVCWHPGHETWAGFCYRPQWFTPQPASNEPKSKCWRGPLDTEKQPTNSQMTPAQKSGHQPEKRTSFNLTPHNLLLFSSVTNPTDLPSSSQREKKKIVKERSQGPGGPEICQSINIEKLCFCWKLVGNYRRNLTQHLNFGEK